MSGDSPNASVRASIGSRRSRVLLASAVCALFLLSPFLSIVPGVSSEPTKIKNADGSRSLVWDFNDPANYTTTNAVVGEGFGALQYGNETLVENSAAGYSQGVTQQGLDIASIPGSIILNDSSKQVYNLTLQPGPEGEDNYMDEDHKNTNYGDSNTLFLDSENGKELRALLRFDLTPVPAGAVVHDAVLWLYLKSGGRAETFAYNVYSVTKPWVEMESNWNFYSTGNTWVTPGGDYDPLSFYRRTLENIVGWHPMDMSRLVDLWTRGLVTNNGIIIVPDSVAGNAFKPFVSSDDSNAAQRPKLIINYTMPVSGGLYESSALGPGTNELFTLMSWTNSTLSRASDEFNGSTLNTKWSWLNDPSAGSGAWDIGQTAPGWLHMTGEGLHDLKDLGANFLYQNITGSFNASTRITTNFSAAAMGAGILLADDNRSWIALSLSGTGSNAKIVGEVSEGGARSNLGTVAWSNQVSAYLGMECNGGSIKMFYSADGVSWTLAFSYTPRVPFMNRLMLGAVIFSGTASVSPVAEWDYFRIDPIGNPTSLEMKARVGNSTTPGDASWETWGGTLSPNTGVVIGKTARYLQYRLVLTSWQDWVTPAFLGMTVNYERYAPFGTIFTQDQTIFNLREWITITTDENEMGGSVQYAYSTDHGAYWSPLGGGGSYDISFLSNKSIMIRIDISTPDTRITPLIDLVNISYSVTPSSFYIEPAVTVVIAGQPFQFRIYARDETNSTIINWAGSIQLHALDATGTMDASSELSDTTAHISVNGFVTKLGETYDVVETIRIMASAEGASGISPPITIIPASVSYIIIQPTITQLMEFESQNYTATVYDGLGNEITDAPVGWAADPAIGTLNATSGPAVQLLTGAGGQEGYLTASVGSITSDLFINVLSPIFAPVFSGPIPDQVKPEDYGSWTLNITSYVSDTEDSHSELRWYVTNERVITVAGENKTGDLVIEFSTKKDMNGVNILNLVVVDSDGLTATTTIKVDIQAVNDPPLIDHISPLVVTWGVDYTYDFKYYIHDADNTYEQLSLRTDVASDPYTTVTWLKITFTYPQSLNGTDQYVVVTVSDGELESSTVVRITVSNDMTPVSTRLPDLIMNQGEYKLGYFNLSNYFSDPDDTVLYYASGASKVKVNINLDHTVDFTAPIDWSGTEYIVFIAQDPEGARSEEAMSVTILHVNQPPSIGDVPNLRVQYDHRYDFDLTPYIYDPDIATETLSISTDDTHIAVIGMTISLLYPQSMNGSVIDVIITVSDGELTASRSIQITIGDDPPPIARDPPDHSFQEDALPPETRYPAGSVLEDYFNDVEDSDPLTFFAFTSSPNVTAEIVYVGAGSSTVQFVTDENYNGICSVTVRATDLEGSIVEETITLDVIPVNDAPSLSPPANQNMTEGAQVAMDLALFVEDPDVEDTEFEFLAHCDYDQYIEVHGSVLVLNFPKGFVPDGVDSKTVNVEIRVRDKGGLMDTKIMTVTVLKAPAIAAKDNPWLYLGLLMTGGAALGLLAVAVNRRKKPFIVQDMMLIHDDGFLIGRHANPHAGEIDQDILSGMLTAVLNFVEDSMSATTNELKTFGFKEYQVLVSRGQKTFVALVYEGDIPDGIEKPLGEFIGTVERIYKKKLANWTGDIETDFAGVEVLIQAFVKDHSKKGKAKMSGIWRTMQTKAKGTVKP
ncbi:MAG: DNRLRE domain-containing protein [Candidatus Thermoplasmatota archaeon]|nr:DNRLRE domain-containing protein [Candidatus Thermoplasmatota archaeon]